MVPRRLSKRLSLLRFSLLTCNRSEDSEFNHDIQIVQVHRYSPSLLRLLAPPALPILHVEHHLAHSTQCFQVRLFASGLCLVQQGSKNRTLNRLGLLTWTVTSPSFMYSSAPLSNSSSSSSSSNCFFGWNPRLSLATTMSTMTTSLSLPWKASTVHISMVVSLTYAYFIESSNDIELAVDLNCAYVFSIRGDAFLLASSEDLGASSRILRSCLASLVCHCSMISLDSTPTVKLWAASKRSTHEQMSEQ